MSVTFIQPSFSAGEIAPALYGRVDEARWHVAATTLRNMYVSFRGGATSRAGTKFVGWSKQTGRSYPPRMVPFQFSLNQGLGLEMGNLYMRVIKNGAFVTESPISITGVTKANPGVVSATAKGATAATATVTGVTSTYAPNDTVNIAGGTNLSEAVLLVTSTQLVSVVLNAAGSSYAAGNTITLAGGTFTTAAVITVNTVSSGKIVTFSVTNAGSYTANPLGGNFTQGSTSGSGTGATFQAAVFGPKGLTVQSAGVYGSTPANPAAQDTTSGIGLGATFTVTYGAVAPFNNGDWVEIGGINGMTQLNGGTYVVASSSTTSFHLTDVYGNNVNTTSYGTYTFGGMASRIYTLTTPWSEQDLAYLKFTQSADVMSICCWNQTTFTEYPPQDLSRMADDDWSVAEPSFVPTVQAPSSCTVTASATGTVDYQYCVTSVNPDDGTESVASPLGILAGAVDITATAGTITVTWAQVANINQYNIYKATPGYSTQPPPGVLFGYAGTAYGNQFLDTNIIADFTQVPPTHQNPFAPGAVVGASIVTSGTGFTTGTTVRPASQGSSGSGAVLLAVVSSGAVTAVTIINGGNNYTTGYLNFSGTGTGATGTYSGLSGYSPGPISTATVTAGGSGYNQGAVVNITTSTGSGAVLLPVFTNGGLSAIVIHDGGAGYSQGDTVSITGGGAGATANLVIGPLTGVNPGVVAYYQERRIYANTINNPDTYWMSQPGAFTNFDSRVPTIASDAITGTPWTVQVNGIQFMVQMPGGVITLTGQGAWLLSGGGGGGGFLAPQPITPASQQAVPQAYNGCSATVPPIKIDYDVLYVQAKGSNVRDLFYNIYANIYTGNDITILSSHLFTGFTILEWAWCEEPYKVVWAVRSDGVMLSLTYLKQQEVTGWARHDTNGIFLSVCNVTEPPVDALYMAVQRFPGTNTAYFIERMDDRIWQTVENCWCVDAGLQLAQPTPSATLTVSSATGHGAVTGFTGLVGGSGYSNLTTAAIVDQNGTGPGTGAVVALTIVSGVITAAAMSSQGTGYVYPALVITDPGGTGSGASATATLNNSATFTASAGVFSAGNVGSVIRIGGGKATVTAYTNSMTVTANITQPITSLIPNSGGAVMPQVAGNWTMTAPVTAITGLMHLAGAAVTGLADGQVVPVTTVSASGGVTLATAASAVTLGLAYQAQLQTIFLDAGQPTVQTRRKKISYVNARVEASRGMKTGVNQPDGAAQSPMALQTTWNNLSILPDGGTPPYGSTIVPLYTGDLRAPVTGGYAKPGQIAFQQDNPLPMAILAVVPEVLGADDPEVKTRPAPPGNGEAA